MVVQEQILAYLEQLRTEGLTLIFTTLTILSESLFIVAIIALLYWCVDKEKAKRWAWIILFNNGLNGVIKNIIRMPRPFTLGVVTPIRVETATSFSFPSGHTQTATSFWGSGMLILKSKASIWIGCIMIALIGFSRLYLGVHWPMDVLGGIVFGAVGIWAASKMLDEKAQINKNHLIGVSIALLIVLVLDVERDLYKAISALWGFVYGAYLEQKYIKFKPIQKKNIQIKKIVVGVIGLVIIYVGIGKLLPDVKSITMIKYTLTLMWIAVGAPYCFNKIKDRV